MRISIKDGGKTPYSVNLSSFNKDVISFGRQSDNDIVLESDFVSRLHGVFYFEGSNLYIEDLKSTNGISYMGNKIQKRQLKDGDVVVISSNTKKPNDNVEIKILSTFVPQKTSNKTPHKNKKYIWAAAGAAGILAVALIALFTTGIIGGGSRKDSGGSGLVGGTVSTASSTDSIESATEDIGMEDAYTPDMNNESDAYFSEISEQIIKVYSVADSANKKTGKEAVDLLAKRGFDEYEVTANTSPDGDITDDTVIADDCEEKYPMYMSFYYTDAGDAWVIYIVDGAIFANPLFYNLESGETVMVMFSESKSIVNYDYYEKRFYEIIPLNTTMKLKVVDRIDSETLNAYTADKIKNME